MNKADVREILECIALNYKTFEITETLFKMWLDELQQYDKEDVMNKLKDMIASGKYNINPPMLMTLVNGLTKKSKKLDWSKNITYCRRCNKAFQCDKDGYSKDYKEHEGKCKSIDYVIKQTKKWFGKELTRAELWAMNEKEFNERYDKLLHYIYNHTEDDNEKTIIGYIFNPPTVEGTLNIIRDIDD